MTRLPVACLTGACLATASFGGAAFADVSDFNTTLTALSGSEFQLVDTFSILYDLDTAYIDADLDNAPDFTQDLDLGQFLGEYIDPGILCARLRTPRQRNGSEAHVHGK